MYIVEHLYVNKILKHIHMANVKVFLEITKYVVNINNYLKQVV